MTLAPQSLPLKQSTWLQRNWKWFVPTACLAGVIVFLGAIALFMALIFGFMKKSDAYSGALVRVKESPAVIDQLGTPISAGWFVTGNIHVSGSSGQAELAIPVSGPKAKATVYVEAQKRLGQWQFDGLVVQIDSSKKRIDLLKKEPNQRTDSTTETVSPSVLAPK
ncbi:MAG: cytochrome c oxidase assembly factor Coa1 family protein [Nibricoccus sp.]